MSRRVSGVFAAVSAAVALTAGCGADEPAAAVPTTTTAPAPTATPSTSSTLPRPAPELTAAGLPTVDPYAGLPLIDRTEWTAGQDGARLLVFPTEAGRRTPFPGAENRAWLEILTGAPDADTPGMYDQFRCHWVWARLAAPTKPSWNLEPWRPAVGYDAVVQAACNPGGPER
ncbi:DUF2599 domain-containing protein [Nocardia harenae]|uniref:DUF2599 domain-containing protein n=1 Tax=Nocardia harenae TaxID=358707 RepID=UPI000834DA11|nr:DUF2599 domain-containing protein [Nocardia harenae]